MIAAHQTGGEATFAAEQIETIKRKTTETNDLLAFDEFCAEPGIIDPIPRISNNFYLHFIHQPGSHDLSDRYRTQEPFERCMQEHPEAFAALDDRIRALYKQQGLDGKEFQEALYEAYTMMRPYAETNWEMFQ